ncbi:PIG-L family deacetylase [Streptomyces sp. NPDC093085]|uniref:PIG-L deacetylase family protein n=1 Tax=Streptomyces sp. NPDC093085 TaxID=3155068 RepID=UPI003427989D
MNVLVVVAHPDDAEIAMGMRMRWYAENGAHVRVHCLTPGAAGPDGRQVRRAECLAAGAVLGVEEYTFSEIPDTRFNDHRGDINGELFRVFGRRRPDTVYTHYPEDQHLDHIVTGCEVTAVALREAANLTYFRSPYSEGFDPNMVFMGTTSLLKAKRAALGCFASQQQLDMAAFTTLARVVHRQHVHHRVVERFPPHAVTSELFQIARRVEIARA